MEQNGMQDNIYQNGEQNIVAPTEEKAEEFFFANGVKNESFIKDNLRKVGILVVFLNIFYPIGWHYKQWKAIKQNNEEYKNISPFWRGLFYPIFSFQLTKIIKDLFEIKKDTDLRTITDEEELKKVKKEHRIVLAPWPYVIFISIVFTLAFMFSPDTNLDKLLGVIAWASIFYPIFFMQRAINYIMPKETKEKVFSLSDLLGAPFFALLLAFFIFSLGLLSVLNDCFETEGKTIKNTCDNYSFTFPFETDELFTATSEDEILYLCQAEKKENIEGNAICLTEIEYPEEHPFNFENMTKELEQKEEILYKKAQTYNGNPACCFIIKGKSFPEPFCFIQIKDNPKYGIHISANPEESEIPLEKLEELMNSYKKF